MSMECDGGYWLDYIQHENHAHNRLFNHHQPEENQKREGNEQEITHVSHPIITDAYTPHLPIFDRILQRSPARLPRLRSSVRRMQQKEVDVAFGCESHRGTDGGANGGIVGAVCGKLGGVVNVFAGELQRWGTRRVGDGGVGNGIGRGG